MLAVARAPDSSCSARLSASPPLLALAMLSVRIPLATIADQQQLQLSPLKRLSLADKENTVREAPVSAGSGVH